MKNEKQPRNSEEQRRGRITARIIDEETGFRQIDHVKAVRIHSAEYVLLIMDDYSPTLGEINGSIAFLTRDDEVTYENIKGFYRLYSNEFTLTIKERQ